MPLRRDPTLRQRRLGAEMRKMREQAGLGGSQLARALGLNPTQVTQMETGRIGVSADRLRTVAAACDCRNATLVDALAEMAVERAKGWWEEYRGVLATDFLEVAEVEGHARKLYTCTTTYIPGLLQTREYASAVFARATPLPTAQDIALRTDFRMRRQRILDAQKVPYLAFIHEAALRMQFGGPRILVDQLAALIEASAAPGISIRVMPFSADTFPGSSENLTFAEGATPELDTVQMDVAHAVQFFDSSAHLASYRSVFARLEAATLAEGESRELIRSVMKEVEGRHV
ncbi:helix-turn-helix domain-containing protein [Kitasatospora purpeofusca]|uniref:helix-turn-helix domain-containing protein n=1 Tax=Kitasatospora purpeofusca TaxID=67352 RepID=UPI00386FE978|nr:helix-turn-helix transcriptional regulator [Kitasatospora purpeofusca]